MSTQKTFQEKYHISVSLLVFNALTLIALFHPLIIWFFVSLLLFISTLSDGSFLSSTDDVETLIFSLGGIVGYIGLWMSTLMARNKFVFVALLMGMASYIYLLVFLSQIGQLGGNLLNQFITFYPLIISTIHLILNFRRLMLLTGKNALR